MKGTMRKFKKSDVLTIPNLLSVIRLLLIPLIVWLYVGKAKYLLAFLLVALSALTDIVDGRIARRFNMVSDFGKILDPVADKLTQASLILCLTVRYKTMWLLIAVFLVKEVCNSLLGIIVIKEQGVVVGAKWYGKLSTVLLYLSMMFMLLFPNLPNIAANILICLCTGTIIFSLISYLKLYIQLLRS